MSASPDIYTCDGCGEVFASDWTEAEARAEMAQRFPGLKPEDAAVLCDDCARAILGGAGLL